MSKAYEVEVRFIGEPDYYYFESRKEAEEAVKHCNNYPPAEAYWGLVYTRATMREIDLAPNEYIQGNMIMTETRVII